MGVPMFPQLESVPYLSRLGATQLLMSSLLCMLQVSATALSHVRYPGITSSTALCVRTISGMYHPLLWLARQN
jgi:hypothetical protein